jgi:hypothetical protein
MRPSSHPPIRRIAGASERNGARPPGRRASRPAGGSWDAHGPGSPGVVGCWGATRRKPVTTWDCDNWRVH